jgi:hypothetical protein
MSAACHLGNSCCLFCFFLRCLVEDSESAGSPQLMSSSSALSDGISKSRIAESAHCNLSKDTLLVSSRSWFQCCWVLPRLRKNRASSSSSILLRVAEFCVVLEGGDCTGDDAASRLTVVEDEGLDFATGRGFGRGRADMMIRKGRRRGKLTASFILRSISGCAMIHSSWTPRQ